MQKRLFSSLLVLLFGISLRCRPVDAVTEDPLEKEALGYLTDYIRIDTSNPPGNETSGALFLKKIMDGAGIESQLLGHNPARRSLYAHLRSGSSEPALLLLSHIDVVPARASEWSVPPFSARQSAGYLWGRGALDIKSLGVAEVMALLALKRSGQPLQRDVILLAVADEEGGGTEGTAALLASRPDLFAHVGFVLNEGGANETIVDKISFWGIETTQKVPLWIQLTCKGEPGHGAVPPDDGGSAAKLVEVLQSLRSIPLPYRVTPPVKAFFAGLARQKRGRSQQVLADPEQWLDSPDLPKLVPASYRSLLHDTMAITQLEAGLSPNAIPSEARATVDFRLLPGSRADEMLEKVRSIVAGRAVIEVLLRGEPVPESSADTELYRLIGRLMTASQPGSRVGPIVSAGTTDSRFFRARGIVAYGFSPFKVNYYDADTIHGIDERIRTHFFLEGVNLTTAIVREFCARKSG
jgi:acetylornithine deacetylase/succinyl-diaminopimelate desuccinylase-like protein